MPDLGPGLTSTKHDDTAADDSRRHSNFRTDHVPLWQRWPAEKLFRDECPRWLNVLRGQTQGDVVKSPNEKEKDGDAPTSPGDFFQKLPKMA